MIKFEKIDSFLTPVDDPKLEIEENYISYMVKGVKECNEIPKHIDIVIGKYNKESVWKLYEYKTGKLLVNIEFDIPSDKKEAFDYLFLELIDKLKRIKRNVDSYEEMWKNAIEKQRVLNKKQPSLI